MRFSSFFSALSGLVAVAQASPHLLPAFSKAGSTGTSCSLAHSWEDHTLFKGIAAPKTETAAAIHLGLNLPKVQIAGDVQLELASGFLQEPRVRLGLGGIKAYVEIDVSASAAVAEAIELFASPALELQIPGLLEVEVGAAVALDLVVVVDAAIDVSAGVYISFPEHAFVEISLLTKDIVDVSLDGLVAKALPLGVGAEVDLSSEINVQFGLRLRTEIDIEAEVNIPVLDIEAGAKIAVWVSLFEYAAVLVNSANCLLSIEEAIAFTLGLAVELDVEVGDILDLSLAPQLTITLATAAKAQLCKSNRGTPGIFLEGPQPSTSAAQDAIVTPTPIATPTPAHGNGTDVTSTFTSTHTYTVTSCAASVINCPASYTQKVVTSTVISSTYVCPATEAGNSPVTTSASQSTQTPVSVTTITEEITTIVPCKERTTKTFEHPTTAPPAPTVTITECPEAPTSAVPSNEVPVESATESAPVPPVETSDVPVTPPVDTPIAPQPPVDTPVVPQPPVETSVVPPIQTAPFPSNNGTIPTPTPIVPGVPSSTGGYTVPVVTTPAVVPIQSTPVATPPAFATTSVPPHVPTGAGNVVRSGMMLAIPAILALLI